MLFTGTHRSETQRRQAAMNWPQQFRGDASPRACSVKRQKQRVGSHTSVADCWEFSSPETPKGRSAHRARKRRPETPNRISAPSLGYEERRTSCCVPHSTGTRAVRSRLYIPSDHAPTLIEARAREAHRQPTEALRPAISSGHEAHETSDRVSFWPFARVASGKITERRYAAQRLDEAQLAA